MLLNPNLIDEPKPKLGAIYPLTAEDCEINPDNRKYYYAAAISAKIGEDDERICMQSCNI